MLLEDALAEVEDSHGPTPISEEERRRRDQERYTQELLEQVGARGKSSKAPLEVDKEPQPEP